MGGLHDIPGLEVTVHEAHTAFKGKRNTKIGWRAIRVKIEGQRQHSDT